MHDRLLIHNLIAQCRLGVTEAERSRPQSVWIDLELAIDATRAAAQDAVEDAVDYARVVSVVRQRAEATPYRLLETLAQVLALLILETFHVPRVMVRVKKRALPGIDDAAVEIAREAP